MRYVYKQKTNVTVSLLCFWTSVALRKWKCLWCVCVCVCHWLHLFMWLNLLILNMFVNDQCWICVETLRPTVILSALAQGQW